MDCPIIWIGQSLNSFEMKKVEFSLLVFFISVLNIPSWAQKEIDSALVYLNINECISCHIFLKNYLIVLNNSDYLVLNIDESIKEIKNEYLQSQKINPSVFNEIRYFNSSELKDPLFESYIVIYHNGKTNTLMLKEPIFLDEETIGLSSDSSKVTTIENCLKFSKRYEVYKNKNKLIISDYLLQKAAIISVTDELEITCENLFFAELGQNLSEVPAYLNEIDIDFNRELKFIFRQMGLETAVESCGIINNDYGFLVSLPKAHANQKDTIIDFIFGIYEPQSADFTLINIETLPENHFLMDVVGFSIIGDTLTTLLEIENFESEDFAIAVFIKNKNKPEFIYRQSLPIKNKIKANLDIESFRIMDNILFNLKSLFVYDLVSHKVILNQEEENERVISLSRLANDNVELVLINSKNEIQIKQIDPENNIILKEELKNDWTEDYLFRLNNYLLSLEISPYLKLNKIK